MPLHNFFCKNIIAELFSSNKMEGAQVLITDITGGISCNLLEWLDEKQATPYVLVKDFEYAHEISEDFPSIIPVVLNVNQSFESTIDLVSALPTMSCIFNFDGEQFENLYRQAFDHFTKSISVCKDDFDVTKFQSSVLDSISEGYTLIVNITAVSLSSQLPLHDHLPPTNLNSSQNLKLVFEKLFSRKHQKLYPQGGLRPRKIVDVEQSATAIRRMSPFNELFRRLFTRFNPCCATSAIHLIPIRSNANYNPPIKSPKEIREYIRSQESQEIQSSFKTIHASAVKNWRENCKIFKISPEFEQQFQRMCNEIERKGKEGKRLLLEKVNKDIERTRQWDHVLGPKIVDRLKCSREKEIERKVEQFCSRKVMEARQKITEEIKQHKIRTKGRFHREVVDEQVMELVRIKEKYLKRLELLMLPYTGELTIPQN